MATINLLEFPMLGAFAVVLLRIGKALHQIIATVDVTL